MKKQIVKKNRRKLEIVYVPLRKLKLWEKNPRKNEAAAKKLAVLIREHGLNSPLVCTRDNVIRKGNTTYKALRILKYKRAPVIYIEFPTKQQAALYSIADNRASQLSEWDDGLLAKLLGQRGKFSLPHISRMTGFAQPEVTSLTTGWEDTKDITHKKKAIVLKRKCPKCGYTWKEKV